MGFTPYTHTISTSEIKSIEDLGFIFEGSSTPPAQFINNNFPNFDLLSVLDTINTVLSPTTGLKLYKKVFFEEGDSARLEIEYYSENCNDINNGLALMRTFKREGKDIIVKHQYFRIPKLFRQQGISRNILKALLQQYVNIGVKKIQIFASLEDGGFIWAKLYFMATDVNDVNAILALAKAQLPHKQFALAERIYNNYYSKHPDGQSFPINKWAELPFMEVVLRKSTWNGAVDLTNPQEFSNFITHALG